MNVTAQRENLEFSGRACHEQRFLMAFRHCQFDDSCEHFEADPGADERISEVLLPPLWGLYGGSDDAVKSHLRHFYEAHSQQLEFVEENHAGDQKVAPLLHQPELPLILDRLEADPTGLIAVWPVTVPREWLEALADAWGSPL
jgi:hypothetical protein